PGSREGGRPLGAHPPARPARRGGDRGHARRGRPAPGAQLRPGAAVTSPASGTRAAAGSRLPVPTHRSLGLLGAGLILALLAGAAPALGRVLVGWNLLVLALLLVDLWRAPRPSSIRAARHLPSPMHLGVEETVTLTLEGPPQLSGVVRDTPPSALVSRGHQQPIPAGSRRRSLTYRVRADTSGSSA